MEHFQAIQPSILLAPYVKQYWFLSVDAKTQGSQRVIPSGCMGLAFNRGDNICSEVGLLPKSSVFGQSTTYTDTYFVNLNLIVVVFQTIGAKALFKMPLNELSKQSIAFDTLSNPQLVELEKRIMNCTDNHTCVDIIEQFLLKRIYQHEDYNYKRLVSVIESINYGQSDISTLAQTACLGYKQFKRVFTEYVGLNPKEFLQITRFSKALHTLQSQSSLSLSEIASECSYYDKSHLIKEFKSFSGYTPSEFRSKADPYSDSKSLFQSFFVNTKS